MARRYNNVATADSKQTKILQHEIELMNLPRVDLNDPDSVDRRIIDWLEICEKNEVKPQVAGMCFALGHSRNEILDIRRGVRKAPRRTVELLNRVVIMLESMAESYMIDMNVNPIPFIFLLKNNYGYTDTTEIVAKSEDKQMSENELMERLDMMKKLEIEDKKDNTI